MVDIDINLRGIVVEVHAMYAPIVNVNMHLLVILIPILIPTLTIE